MIAAFHCILVLSLLPHYEIIVQLFCNLPFNILRFYRTPLTAVSTLQGIVLLGGITNISVALHSA